MAPSGDAEGEADAHERPLERAPEVRREHAALRVSRVHRVEPLPELLQPERRSR